MRSPGVSVFSYRSCFGLTRVSIVCQAMFVLLACIPAVWSQDSAKNSDKSAVTTPSDPQEAGTARSLNDRIAQLAAAQPSDGTDYVLGSDDLLGVEVFDVPELTRDVRVSESGLISLPLLPVKVRAAGLTAFQLQDKVAELLQVNGLVSNPQVTVSVKEQHGQPITVMGAVKSPMVIQAVRQMTLLEVLSRAGGIADDAAGQVLVTHKAAVIAAGDSEQENSDALPATDTSAATTDPASAESLTVRVSLSDLLDSGDSKFNLALQGGDVVSVPRAGVVYAVGAVQRPGGFVMANDRQQLTVLKVLALSGGLAPTAKKKEAVIIRQSAEPNQRQVPVNLEQILAFKAEDPLLLQSDILFVPSSGGKEAFSRVATTALGMASGVAIIRLGR
jgi:polysaccharide export outer membrane protein